MIRRAMRPFRQDSLLTDSRLTSKGIINSPLNQFVLIGQGTTLSFQHIPLQDIIGYDISRCLLPQDILEFSWRNTGPRAFKGNHVPTNDLSLWNVLQCHNRPAGIETGGLFTFKAVERWVSDQVLT